MSTIENRLRNVLEDFCIKPSTIDKKVDYYYDLNLNRLELMILTVKIINKFIIPDPEVIKNGKEI